MRISTPCRAGSVWSRAMHFLKNYGVGLGLLALYLMGHPCWADGTDIMGGSYKGVVEPSVGPTSDLMLIIYTAEALTALYQSIRTKNWGGCFGILIMVIFVEIVFTYIISSKSG